MKKITTTLLIIVSGCVFAELPISATRFRKTPIEEVTQYARQNDAEAQLELALRYYAGHQVSRNAQDAFAWACRSAGLANSDAQFLLSRMYAEGVGVAPDALKEENYFTQAIGAQPDNKEMQEQYTAYLKQKKKSPDELKKFITQCAEAGYSPAYVAGQASVATNLFAEGKYEEALPIFRQLAEKGDPSASYYLAQMYSKGLGGLLEDHVEAFGLYERAASNNYAEAQYQLAVMYATGQGVLEDDDKAVFWYKKAARNGHAEAQYRFAESEFKKAIFWQEESRQEEAVEDQRNEDMGKYRQRLSSAVSWYEKAAEQNQRDAQYIMGRLYASGEGVIQNFAEAVRLYELAAAQGHAKAQFYLGLMYQAGLGVEQDTPKAIKLYDKAADKKEPGAKFYLGNCYRFGIGVAKDPDKGGKYYAGALNSALSSARKSENDGLKNFWVQKNGPNKLARMILDDEWLSSIARECGIGLWGKANSETELDAARTLVGKAAQNGDVKAQEILLKMNIKDRLSYRRDAGFMRPEISEDKADARADAVRQMRATAFLPIFLQGDLKTLYPKSEAERNIVGVQTYNNRCKNVAGEGLWEFWYKIRSPDVRDAADFRGVTFICVEFTDRESGKKYVGFTKTKLSPAHNSAVASLKTGDRIGSMYLNLNPYPDARLTGWAVVYGHQLKDETVLAVFDAKSKNRRTFIDLCRDNANSKRIETIMESASDSGDADDDEDDPSE